MSDTRFEGSLNVTVDDLVRWVRSRWFGKYRGSVIRNDDANQQGRLLVEVPAVLGNVQLWAMPCVPYAGAGVGLYLLPDAGTGVWVEFEGGDPSYPIWTGCFWGAGQIPDVPDAGVKVLRTGGLTIRLDDGAGELLLSSDSGGQISITDSVAIEAGGATHEVGSSGVVSAKGGSSVEIGNSSVSINRGAFEVGM